MKTCKIQFVTTILLLLTLLPATSFAQSEPSKSRPQLLSPKSWKIGLGIGGLLLEQPLMIAPGGKIWTAYEVDGSEITATVSLHGNDQDDEAFLANLSLGYRSLFDLGSNRLFLGGGLAIGYHRIEYNDDHYESVGIEPFAEVGIEMFSLYTVRAVADVKAGFPLFLFENYNVPVTASTSVVYAF